MGLHRLVDDAVHDLTVLRKAVTPETIREYVSLQVRLNVEIGEYLAPTDPDLAAALDEGLLEQRCSDRADADGPTP